MRVARVILLLATGAVAGILFMIVCGDGSRLEAHAATDPPLAPSAAAAETICDCPPAEPPLAGRFSVVSQLQVIAGNGTGSQSATCPAGAQLISGSCTTDFINPIRNVTLQQAGFYDNPPTTWHCFFRNNEATPVTIRASVVCLEPPPAP